MSFMTKMEPVLIIVSLLAGFLFSFSGAVSNALAGFEEPLLSVLLFFIFLEIDFSKFWEAFRNLKFIFSALLFNFVWTPVFAFILSKIFLGMSLPLQIALVLLLVMPCTDWFLIFTDITGGNVTQSSAILPVNLVLQLILLPFYLYFFFRNASFVFDWALAIETIGEILIPVLLAILVRKLLLEKDRLPRIKKFIETISEKGEFLMICLIAFTIFASEGQEFVRAPQLYPMFLAALIVFYTVNFTLGYLLAKALKFDAADIISLVFIVTARNSALTLSLAGILFPTYPVIALVLLIGPLTELPVSAIESALLKRLTDKHNCKNLVRKECK